MNQNNELAKLRRELDEALTKTLPLERMVDELQRRNMMLSKELEKEKTQRSREKDGSEKAIANLTGLVNKKPIKPEEMTALQYQIDFLTRDRDELWGRYKKIQEENAKLQEATQSIQDQLAKAKADQASLQEANRAIQRQLELSRVEVNTLRAEKIRLTAVNEQLQDSITALEFAQRLALRTADDVPDGVCSICYANAADMEYLPCGHIAACSDCVRRHRESQRDRQQRFGRTVREECPFCRAEVTSTRLVRRNAQIS
jgi:chromosome segregation ATPase